jgi:hypothetical protein
VGTVVSIGGMKNKVTVDFGNNTLAPSDETGSIMLHAASTTSRWAILLPQTESVTTTATAEGYYESYNFTVPSVAINDYLTGNDGACFGLFTPLTMPLTLEVLDYGNIMVNISGTLSTGMYYSVNGGEKHLIYTTTTIEDLDFGDKVQFYGNGTSTQVYGGDTEVKLLGTAETMVYGNIMSLIDEDNYATCTTLPNREYVFYGLFEGNSNLIDASGLLLPATTLASDCYAYMFYECTRLTAAPALPAETLVNRCYRRMFYGCTSLSSITCLATSGINSSSSTSEWMFNAGIIVTWTKTFTAASTATWPTGDNGIPKKWTRVNVQ